eukprot:TRINITY_DN34831_c0_g1_i1.p1 TRINITY_DN34831_c0_g1~~TRINITY_DN34831_c0_g1_i1.p1  ORF type:complete len:109 (-),score=27.03 TRINITY_DN34831_c0_g1_i1:100-426(-)
MLILRVLVFFFFQAEDGIRDAQESRGLGDVYKRQWWGHIRGGLLYQGTCHRLMTEVLLTEIGRRPMSDSTLEREGYSLAAGLALGLVSLGKGGKSSGFEDLHLSLIHI